MSMTITPERLDKIEDIANGILQRPTFSPMHSFARDVRALVAHVREVERERDDLADALSHVNAGFKSAMERAKAERDDLAAKLAKSEAELNKLVLTISRLHAEDQGEGA